ncbi:maleylpyruvate isomerase family mycothiol-dependent enzyme [Occultella gossypii]|uniref:Maleylpyruvate isomerase family mycothiol-dependent enzyme n=1 Tax=Occultella gossypii TaxID=2800820 RepID=A0ABS7SDI0_9MICO|nr:maleylpyruvate isomerase family mycothiol-dependent enzyme [Occultella gossypii]MBZ2198408.1 maleylpyruvate isomerase family mycothiol-dependent enzyme [Occultella gossypii]
MIDPTQDPKEVAVLAATEGGDALTRVIDALATLDDQAVRAPSALPDWTRGHLLAHLDGVGNAFARQLEFAARGELIEVYEGGRPGRNARIEQLSVRSRDEHLVGLGSLRDRLAAAWPAPGSPGWDASVTYYDGTVVDVALAWWREAGVHQVDLVAGIGVESWSVALCEHLLDFLGVRLPEGEPVVINADDEGLRYAVGPGLDELDVEGGGTGADDETAVEVTGALRDITSWLAGRAPAVAPVATRAGAAVDLQELGPWPSPPTSDPPRS